MGFHYNDLKASLNLKEVLFLPNLPKGSSTPISITGKIYVSRQPMQAVWLTSLTVTLGKNEFDLIAEFWCLTLSPQSLGMLATEDLASFSLEIVPTSSKVTFFPQG